MEKKEIEKKKFLDIDLGEAEDISVREDDRLGFKEDSEIILEEEEFYIFPNDHQYIKKYNDEYQEKDNRDYINLQEIKQKQDALVLEYTLEESEIFHTMQNIYNFQFGKRRIIQSILLAILLVIFSFLLIKNNQKNFYYMIGLCIILLILIWILPFLYNRFAAKKNFSGVSKVTAVLEKDQVSFYQDGDRSTLKYLEKDEKTKKNRLKILEYPDIYIFLSDNKSLYCLPKRAISESDYTNKDIRDLFKTTLPSYFYKKT